MENGEQIFKSTMEKDPEPQWYVARYIQEEGGTRLVHKSIRRATEEEIRAKEEEIGAQKERGGLAEKVVSITHRKIA